MKKGFGSNYKTPSYIKTYKIPLILSRSEIEIEDKNSPPKIV